MKRVISKLTIALLFATWLMSYSFAEDKALFIGLSEYSEPRQNLMGPNIDVQLMIDIARKLGFNSSQMEKLYDEDATRGNILRELRNLAQGVTSEDKILIYYSGHGIRVEDTTSQNGCDEALVPYGGKDNAITGDDISAALANNPAAEILFIVDSCFSGNLINTTKGAKSTHRSLGGVKIKQYNDANAALIRCDIASNIKGTRSIGLEANEVVRPINLNDRTLYLSASGHDQVALAALKRGEGSLFTQSLSDKLANSQDVSFNQLVKAVTEVMKERVEQLPDDRFLPPVPTIEGPLAWQVLNFSDFGQLRSKAIEVMQTPSSLQIDALLDAVKGNSSFDVRVTSHRQHYRLREYLNFQVYTERAGYLYVYDRGAAGELTLLFPNRYAPNPHYMQAHSTVNIPDDLLTFRFPAIEPVGESRLVAIVHNDNLNLYNNPICGVSSGFDVCHPSQSNSVLNGLNKSWGLEGTYSGSQPLTNGKFFGVGELYVTVTY